jgi:hypothetical protein
VHPAWIPACEPVRISRMGRFHDSFSLSSEVIR